MLRKLNITFLALALTAFYVPVRADNLDKLQERARKSAEVLYDNAAVPERSIPASLMRESVCIATVPHVVHIGFIFGGRYGKGLVSCRVDGGWSLPVFIKVKGGSWGAQFGAEAVDLVLVFVRDSAVESFTKNNFTMGADASVSAGPVGRSAHLGTDYRLKNEIYSYSRSRGLFAGLTVQGTSIEIAKDYNQKVYGDMTAEEILMTRAGTHLIVDSYTRALERLAP